MTLFQIAEPGQSQIKEACHRRAVGIDLGTTNSLIASVIDGAPTILCDDDDEALTPSVVHYGAGGEVVVGAAAKALAANAPSDTIASVKRFVGRGPSDVEASRALTPYEFAHGDGEGDGPDSDGGRLVRFSVAGGARAVTPVEVSAEILRALLRRASARLGGPVEDAVITVPAYFDDAQRQATRDAGRLAGVNVLRLLAEPTAAALAYGLDRGSQGIYAVYDLGGGTFDISILQLVDGVFEVKAIGGDSALGGDDIDHALAERMLAEAGRPDGDGDKALVRQALDQARAVKERLSERAEACYRLQMPDGTGFERGLTRADLAEAMRPLLDRTARACRRALRDAEIRAKALDGVILVGGSTRSPVVRDFVAELFGHDPMCDLDPEHVVALGASAQADRLAGGKSEVVLLDVVPLSLGIETMGGVVEKLIPRNSTIPTGAKQEFTTYADEQTGFDIHVVQGERETADANRSLARFLLRGVPPMPAGMARVEISFVVDADGILRVSAREQLTGIENAIEVRPSYGLTDEEVERMLMDSYEHAEEDLAQRNLQVERVEAERILDATRKAMEVDAALLDEEVAVATRAAMAHLEAVMAGTDHRAIHDAVEALDRASKPFAERRMNRAVRAAVQGHRVDEVEHSFSG
ncbi:Fe-S protein assembly chaperone HscA [Haliangium sp.]|uniref:Fe-S protein assembly chaperone HscA n=1 Tax=Haliangium sp. TaxID=2663208 RepID=UPI003D0F058C